MNTSRAAALVGMIIFFVWLLCALRLGDAYPLADFTMFAEPISMPSRVMAKPAQGEVVEVFDLQGWSCPPDLNLNPRGPVPFFQSRDVDQSVIRHLRTHPGEGDRGEPVTLVRRVFLLTQSGPEVVADLPIAPCWASSPTPPGAP